jgi:hypothetical protein
MPVKSQDLHDNHKPEFHHSNYEPDEESEGNRSGHGMKEFGGQS